MNAGSMILFVLAPCLGLLTTSVGAFASLPQRRRQQQLPLFFLAAASPNDDGVTTATAAIPPASPENVQVLIDADAVGAQIREIVRTAAAEAIQERGHFFLQVPGGSILKMLVGTGGNQDDETWTKHTTLAYVNHKCVAMDDQQLATHAKASKLFLNDWNGCQTLVMNGTDDGAAEAEAYQAQLQALEDLPRNDQGFPVFDLALIGVGDDGHVGSLYPNRDEVLDTTLWVLPVDMKQPPSITLSLPVMAAARQVVVAACGVSDKYPQGKSAGMKKAIADADLTLTDFPAVGLRSVATWVMDEAAASKLGEKYHSNSNINSNNYE